MDEFSYGSTGRASQIHCLFSAVAISVNKTVFDLRPKQLQKDQEEQPGRHSAVPSEATPQGTQDVAQPGSQCRDSTGHCSYRLMCIFVPIHCSSVEGTKG